MFDSQHIKADADKGVLVVEVKSEKISEYEATIIQNEIANLAKGMNWKIALDMSQVQMIASVGLGMLVSLNRTAKTNKGKLALCKLNDPIRQVLKLTRLDTGLTIVADRPAAISACG
jgi:anti-anti-sigma factor